MWILFLRNDNRFILKYFVQHTWCVLDQLFRCLCTYDTFIYCERLLCCLWSMSYSVHPRSLSNTYSCRRSWSGFYICEGRRHDHSLLCSCPNDVFMETINYDVCIIWTISNTYRILFTLGNHGIGFEHIRSGYFDNKFNEIH